MSCKFTFAYWHTLDLFFYIWFDFNCLISETFSGLGWKGICLNYLSSHVQMLLIFRFWINYRNQLHYMNQSGALKTYWLRKEQKKIKSRFMLWKEVHSLCSCMFRGRCGEHAWQPAVSSRVELSTAGPLWLHHLWDHKRGLERGGPSQWLR